MRGAIWQLGASEDAVRVVEEDDGTIEMNFTYETRQRPLVGRGSTAVEAAKHLAEQLREQARLVEAVAGRETSTSRRTMIARERVQDAVDRNIFDAYYGNRLRSTRRR